LRQLQIIIATDAYYELGISGYYDLDLSQKHIPLFSQSNGNSFSARSDSVIKFFRAFNHEYFSLLAVLDEDLYRSPKIAKFILSILCKIPLTLQK
jgi:hypothetical protein